MSPLVHAAKPSSKTTETYLTLAVTIAPSSQHTYMRITETTSRTGYCEYCSNPKLNFGLPARLVLVRATISNQNSVPASTMRPMSAALNSEPLHALQRAINIVVLWVRTVMFKTEFSPKPRMCSRKWLTSHVSMYRDWGSLPLKTPSITWITKSCWPTFIPPILGWNAEMAEQWLLIVECS